MSIGIHYEVVESDFEHGKFEMFDRENTRVL